MSIVSNVLMHRREEVPSAISHVGVLMFSRTGRPVRPCPPEPTPDQKKRFPMSKIDTRSLDTAFIPPGTPMFSDLMQHLEEATDLSPSRRRDLQSDLRRVAKALGRSPGDVPADAKWLQPRLSRVAPAALGLSAKSWSNALSDARAALLRCGIAQQRGRPKTDLTPEWDRLWALIRSSRDMTLKCALGRFVSFLSGQGVHPDAVCNEHALAFKEAVALNEISRSPETAYRLMVNGWNLAAQRIYVWPKQRLSAPSPAKAHPTAARGVSRELPNGSRPLRHLAGAS